MYRVLMQCGVAWCSGHGVCSSAPPYCCRDEQALSPSRVIHLSAPPSQIHVEAAGASFRDASLYKTDFSHSNLAKAVFDGADVSGASFAHSNLRGASFMGAHGLETADFTDALARP